MSRKESDYEVGYGKPPKNSQFEKGKSGNPLGRPKATKNTKTVVRDVLEKSVKIREGERTKSASLLEVIVRRVTQEAAQGDLRACLATLKLAEQHGLMEEEPTRETTMSPTEQALLDEIIDALRKIEQHA